MVKTASPYCLWMHVQLGRAMRNAVAAEEQLGDSDNQESESETPSRTKTTKQAAIRPDKLPDIWSQMCNDSSCLIARLLNYFSEPEQFRSRRESRCCSKCNIEYSIGDLDDAKYHLYSEHGTRLGNRKPIVSALFDWAETQLDVIYTDRAFPMDGGCIVDPDTRNLLGRNAHDIKDAEKLRNIIPEWPYHDDIGESLVRELKRLFHETQQKAGRRRVDKSLQASVTASPRSLLPAPQVVPSYQYNLPTSSLVPPPTPMISQTQLSPIPPPPPYPYPSLCFSSAATLAPAFPSAYTHSHNAPSLNAISQPQVPAKRKHPENADDNERTSYTSLTHPEEEAM